MQARKSCIQSKLKLQNSTESFKTPDLTPKENELAESDAKRSSESNCKVRCDEHRIIHQDVLQLLESSLTAHSPHKLCRHDDFGHRATLEHFDYLEVQTSSYQEGFLFPLCINSNWSAVTATLFPHPHHDHPHMSTDLECIAFLNSHITTSSLRLSHIISSFSDLAQRSKIISFSL